MQSTAWWHGAIYVSMRLPFWAVSKNHAKPPPRRNLEASGTSPFLLIIRRTPAKPMPSGRQVEAFCCSGSVSACNGVINMHHWHGSASSAFILGIVRSSFQYVAYVQSTRAVCGTYVVDIVWSLEVNNAAVNRVYLRPQNLLPAQLVYSTVKDASWDNKYNPLLYFGTSRTLRGLHQQWTVYMH